MCVCTIYAGCLNLVLVYRALPDLVHLFWLGHIRKVVAVHAQEEEMSTFLCFWHRSGSRQPRRCKVRSAQASFPAFWCRTDSQSQVQANIIRKRHVCNWRLMWLLLSRLDGQRHDSGETRTRPLHSAEGGNPHGSPEAGRTGISEWHLLHTSFCALFSDQPSLTWHPHHHP